MTYLMKYIGYMGYFYYYSHGKEILIMIEIMVRITHITISSGQNGILKIPCFTGAVFLP